MIVWGVILRASALFLTGATAAAVGGIIDVHGNRDKFDASRRSFGTRAFVLGAGYVVRHVHVFMAVQAQQSELERYAASQGALRLHLLTQSATGFFTTTGYEIFDRDEAPLAIRQTAQFKHLCPASATYLRKSLGTSVVSE